MTLTQIRDIRQGHWDPAAGDQHSWLKPVTFSLSLGMFLCSKQQLSHLREEAGVGHMALATAAAMARLIPCTSSLEIL